MSTTTTRSTRLAAGALAVAAIGSALAGCGSSGNPSSASPSASLASASAAGSSAAGASPTDSSAATGSATPSTATPTAGATGSATTSPAAAGPRAGAALIVDASKALRAQKTAALTFRFTVTAGSVSEAVAGSGLQDLTSGNTDLHVVVKGQTVETRTVGGTTYTRLPHPVGGKQWLKSDTRTQSAQGAGLTDPTSSLQVLSAGLGPVRDLGKAEAAGTSTEHYATTVDIAAAAAKQPSLRTLATYGVKTVPVEVWIDGQGRLRQLTEVVVASRFPGGGSGTVATTITWSRLGVPASITAPPASQLGTATA